MVQINLVHPGQCIRHVTAPNEEGSCCISMPRNRQQCRDNICYGLNMNGPPQAYVYEQLMPRGGAVLGRSWNLKEGDFAGERRS